MADDRQWVLVTGASAGIGRCLAEIFAREGFDLVLVSRREAALADLAAGLTDRHDCRTLVLAADLSLNGAAEHLFQRVLDAGIAVSVLVNNAGVLHYGEFLETDLSAQLRMIQLNALSLTALCHLFAADMSRRGGGRILNLASIAAFQPVPTLAAYAATKAYVLSLTEALAEELRPRGISVTALCPGFSDTDMLRGATPHMPTMMRADPAQVAEEGYRALMAGRPLRVAGLTNRLFSSLVQLPPRWLVRSVGGLVSRKLS